MLTVTDELGLVWFFDATRNEWRLTQQSWDLLRAVMGERPKCATILGCCPWPKSSTFLRRSLNVLMRILLCGRRRMG